MAGRDALIIVDIQNDFCPGGALAVPGGDRVVEVVNGLSGKFEVVVATQDWHPPGHGSFASSHPGKDVYDTVELGGVEQMLWPDHCVQGTHGAEFHPGLDSRRISAVIRKGMDPGVDSYSAFRDNARQAVTGLDGYLRGLGVTGITIAGLALDFCVYYSGLDGLENGYEVTILLDGCRGIDVPRGAIGKKLEDIRARGGKVESGA